MENDKFRLNDICVSSSTIPSYGDFDVPAASTPLTPDSPKEFLSHVDRGVYVIKSPSEVGTPSVERLPYATPVRPSQIQFCSPEDSSKNHNELSPESPQQFLSPVDKGVYVINSTLESTDVINSTLESTQPSIAPENHEIPEPNNDTSRQLFYKTDENKERGNWTGRFDFLLSMLGYCVGLGNIWRFPYLCYRNGGGAFLFPFIIMMILVGIPLFYLEAALGQFCSRGPTGCWEFCPLFKGIGIAMVICSTLASIYYNVLITWSILYFFSSFTSDLPWSGCSNSWNTKDCSLLLPKVTCTEINEKRLPNGTCYVKETFKGIWNDTMFRIVTGRRRVSPSEEFWNYNFLSLSTGIDNIGSPKYQLALGLLFAWFLCFLCLLKGIKTTGKVVYFTAVFPYIVLFILFFRGIILRGAGDGIYFYIVPKFERLLDAKVWRDATIQIFYSMSPGWGGLIALSSYNRFHNNVFRDSIIASLGDCLTSVFGGFVIFSYLGYMARKQNVDIEEVATSGAGLAFVVYPEAVNMLPLPTFWSLLFFLMLITLGLDSQFAMLETLLTGVIDYFPRLRPKKTIVILIICIVLYLLGLPMTTPGGMYILQLMDHYAASWSLLIIGLTEVIIVSYLYGATRFYKDLEVMLGYLPCLWWKICWMFISPIIIVFILLFSWIDYTPAKYGSYTYPPWANGLGWLMSFASIIFIPIVMLYKINKEDEAKGGWEKIKLLVIPTREWGPALVQHRKLVTYVKGFVTDPRQERGDPFYVNYGYDSSAASTSQLSVGTANRSCNSEHTVKSHVSYESAV